LRIKRRVETARRRQKLPPGQARFDGAVGTFEYILEQSAYPALTAAAGVNTLRPLMGASGQTYRLALSLLVVCAASPTCVSTTLADEATLGVIILRNGNVLEGAVQALGDYYMISSAGASLRVPADQVERACGSLAEAYELRRKERAGASADSHLDLARWCLRHNLLDQAGREIQEARLCDAHHSALTGLDLQLRQMVEIRAMRPSGRSAELSAPPAIVPALPSLDAMPLSQTPEQQSEFIRSVQPMLVHNCATGGCHQPGAIEPFQLDRWALQGNGNATLIRRNLEAVIAQIDKEEPAASPLVQYARQSHGNNAAAVMRPLTSRQAALLKEWVNRVAGVEPPAAEEPTAATDDETSSGQPEHPIGNEAPVIQQATATAPVEKFVPRDAFDPEIFNRKHAAANRANSRAETQASRSAEHAITEQSAAASPAPAATPTSAPAESAASSDTPVR
jgi:hypothetical protein